MHFPLVLHPCTAGWQLQWPDSAAVARREGFAAVVLSRDQAIPPEAPAGTPLPVRSLLLAAEPRRDEETFRQTLPRLRPQACLAARLGCAVAPVGLPPSSEQPKAERAAELRRRLRICQEVLDEFGIRLALEPITPLALRRQFPYEFIWKLEEMLDFAHSISPHCGLAVDSWHWHHAGADAAELAALPPAAILDVHVSDSPPLPPDQIRDLERCVPGEGVIDFQAFFQALPYQGHLTVEIFGSRLRSLAPEAAVAEAYRCTNQLLTTL
ncbi:MAG: sugar phosphate isomerase/epimerase [Bryobacteraceae bacterium]|nr:sugar phosphate isomerase/epimerase [Bryobacteraceae bacterium]